MGIDPASLAIEATVASAVVGGAGQVMSGYAANNAAKFNAGMSMNNATIAKQNSELAGQIGTAKAERSEMKTAAQIGATTASQGASGVKIGSKSFQDVRESEQKIGALEAMNIRSNAAREAYGFKVQEVSDVAQAKQYKAEGKAAVIGGYMGAAESALGAAAKVAGSKNPKGVTGGGTWDSYTAGKGLSNPLTESGQLTEDALSGTGGLY